jgi:hypothetical protein
MSHDACTEDRPTWTKPALEEVRMDAEIGSYEADDERREPSPIVES